MPQRHTFLLLFTMIPLAGCSGDRDNPFDQTRCDPACSGGQVCYEGQCVAPDGGMDAVLPDGTLPDGPANDGANPDTQTDADPGDAPLTEDQAPDSQPDSHMPCNVGADAGCVYDPGRWIEVAATSFAMGSPESEPCREPATAGKETRHPVKLTHDFVIYSTEVTQHAFTTLRGYNPAHHTTCGTACPVENVTWHEAAAYCNDLSVAEGRRSCYACTGSGSSVSCTKNDLYSAGAIADCPGFRLPTEAEWELTYRAGTMSALYNGSLAACSGMDNNADAIGWYAHNAKGMVRPSGQKETNAWGVRDMAGNVTEWVHDGFASDLGRTATQDPSGVSSASERAVRGGTFATEPTWLRGAARTKAVASDRSPERGFRCARTVMKWRPVGTMRTMRRSHSATLLANGKVLVVGGQDETNAKVASAELYDPSTGQWAPTGSMTQKRHSHTAVLLLDGKVLVAGGYDFGSTPSTEIYDPSTGQWSEKGPMRISRYGHALVTLNTGKVLAAGGYSDWGPEAGYQSTAELYDPAAGSWTDTTSLPTTRHKALWALLNDGRLLMAGGQDDGNWLHSALLYDAQSASWTATTGAMDTSRGAPLGDTNATLLPDGRVLIAGKDGGNATHDSALLFDPQTGTFSDTGSMAQGRGVAAFTLLADGRVLAVGGDGLDSAEIYDAKTGNWSSTESLAGERRSHTATLLEDGSVLVCGGSNNMGAVALGSCDLYR